MKPSERRVAWPREKPCQQVLPNKPEGSLAGFSDDIRAMRSIPCDARRKPWPSKEPPGRTTQNRKLLLLKNRRNRKRPLEALTGQGQTLPRILPTTTTRTQDQREMSRQEGRPLKRQEPTMLRRLCLTKIQKLHKLHNHHNHVGRQILPKHQSLLEIQSTPEELPLPPSPKGFGNFGKETKTITEKTTFQYEK